MRTRSMLFVSTQLLFLYSLPNLARGDSYSFATIPPAGTVSGAPGSTVGWGYSLTNNSASDWLVTTDLNTGPFVASVPNLIFDFPILNPGATVMVPYNPSLGTGLFELTWDSSAAPGLTNSGDFVLSAQWWSGDPSDGGSLISEAADASAPYSATVNTPEPGSLLLCIPGLFVIVMCGFVYQLRTSGGTIRRLGGIARLWPQYNWKD